MEKDIGKIKKTDNTDIVVRIDDFGGKRGLTVREFVTSERYTGFTKAGTRIPAESFFQFRELINNIDYNEFMNKVSDGSKVSETSKETKKKGRKSKVQKSLDEVKKPEESESKSEDSDEDKEETEEKEF